MPDELDDTPAQLPPFEGNPLFAVVGGKSYPLTPDGRIFKGMVPLMGAGDWVGPQTVRRSPENCDHSADQECIVCQGAGCYADVPSIVDPEGGEG